MPNDQTGADPGNGDPGQIPQVPPRPMPGTVEPTQWESKFHGLRGSFKQAQAAWQEKEGMLTQQIKTLQGQLGTLNSQLGNAQSQVEQFQAQVEALPQLQERAEQADAFEVQLERLGTIMNYPEILAQTEEAIVGEGEEATTERRNPIMDLLMSSTMEGDAFVQMVEQVATKLRAGQQLEPEPSGEGEPEPRNPPAPIGAPPPPAPTGGDTLESLRKQAMEAQMSGDYQTATKLWDQVLEAENKQQ